MSFQKTTVPHLDTQRRGREPALPFHIYLVKLDVGARTTPHRGPNTLSAWHAAAKSAVAAKCQKQQVGYYHANRSTEVTN
jgi:hypothetical protein